MARDQALEVALNKANAPVRFEWRGRTYRVKEIQECWRLVGAWWDGEEDQTFFRVLTDKGGIYELRFDHRKGSWAMAAIQD
jgi:hypothetical protein